MAHCPCCGQDIAENPIDVLAVKVSPHKATILRKLATAKGQFVPTQRIADAVWANDPEGGPLVATDLVRVKISQMRPVLRAHGFEIEGRPQCGYRLLKRAA